MQELLALPNIGKVLAHNLMAVGVESSAQLRDLGAKEVFLRIRATVDAGACIRQLYALEGAILGLPDTRLPEDITTDLKAFFRKLPKEAGAQP